MLEEGFHQLEPKNNIELWEELKLKSEAKTEVLTASGDKSSWWCDLWRLASRPDTAFHGFRAGRGHRPSHFAGGETAPRFCLLFDFGLFAKF